MKHVFLIAAAEWRYWLRSYLVIGATLFFVILLVATSILTVVQMEEQSHARARHQSEADETFLSQPDRHPHRMVHYGHYVFRAPAALAKFDPGVDPITGQSIFLEGHRQNSAMFAGFTASADLGSWSWLTPAVIYQLFAPMLIILLGHGGIVRERESGMLIPLLAHGMSGHVLIAGKALAILSFVVFLLIPLLGSGAMAFADGESPIVIGALIAAYWGYLTIWGLITLLASVTARKRTNVLATLTALWIGTSLVLPSVAVNVASHSAPLAGKIETDLMMSADLREMGDGHNADDAAFQQLRNHLLEKYRVERIEDLPINFRGAVAFMGEQQLTDVLNKYGEERMAGELQQAQLLTKFGWLTPTLAIADASRALSGTDLKHHHRFLREAEALRFDFVQRLNLTHQEKLSYEDDINRNQSEEARHRARVDASNWKVLDAFQFKPAAAFERLATVARPIGMLLMWFGIIVIGLVWFGGRVRP